MTASAFQITRVQPRLGRTIQPADEQPGAEAVVVLGFDLWRARFAGEPSVVGRTVRLGSTPHTVVGVMPEGFLFPERQHAWTALRAHTGEPSEEGVPVAIFGRLAEGVDDDRARSEFALVAERLAVPDRDDRLVPRVERYAFTLLPGLDRDLKTTPEFIGFQSVALVILLVACAKTVLFDEGVESEDRQVLLVVTRLWGRAGPGPVWEAVVRTTSETDEFQHRERRLDELVSDLVSKLAEWIPLNSAADADRRVSPIR